MEVKTNYLEITKILSGTNKVSICFNSLISYTLKKHNINHKSFPIHLIHHTIENLYYNFQISGLIPSFMYTKGQYDIIYEYFKERLDLKFNEKFFNGVLVYPIQENIQFINSVFKEGTFVFLMNDIYFEFPFIHAHLLIEPLTSYFEDEMHEFDEFDASIDENLLVEIDKIYRESEPVYHSINVSDNLSKQILNLRKDLFYDPHIHYSLVNKINLQNFTQTENFTQNFVKNLHYANKIIESNFSELDYRINVEEKTVKEQQNYAAHLKMLSNSLGTDNLFPIPQKEKAEIKTSSKTRKIVEENLKKLRLVEKQKENDFLKLLFDKYQNSTDKFLFFDTLKINDSFEEAKRKVVLLKIEFFYNEWLTESRKEKPFEGKKVNCYFNIVNYIEKYHCNFKNEFDWTIEILRKLGFESTAHELVKKENLKTEEYNFKIPESPNDTDISFLLKYYGPYLKRSVDSRKDARVFFEPDYWQVQLLDLIDKNKSVIVSAPTSSGKTFICFYVIHKLLSLTDNIILFILPTKALVNQVTADIYSRFSQRNTKQFLQGQIMQEYSINPFNSQVILTVPSMAEQILLTRKISYVILDECHLICENESVERILHIVNCPIVMLSATIGNINEFYEEVYEIFKCKPNDKSKENLKNKSEKKDDKLIYCIEYKERYCDIKPFVFNNTLVPINTLFAYTYDYIKEYGFTNDLNFLPDEILNLYYSIYHVIKNKSLIHEIRPQKYFNSNLLNKRDVILYENYLLKTVQKWINDKMLSEKEVNKLYFILTKESREVFEELKKIKKEDDQSEEKGVYHFTTMDYMLNNITELCNTLKSKEMLPCIIFNTDRRIVDALSVRLFNELSELNVTDTRVKDKLLKEKNKRRG